ncbi:MAG: hypothetical protein WBJ81_01620 [Rickettsiales bacterium]
MMNLIITEAINYDADTYSNKLEGKLIDATIQAYSTINLAIVNNLPTSVTKAIYIDAPINLYSYLTDPKATASQAFYKTGISAATYEIRVQSKAFLMELGLDQNTAGALAGFAGGAFKYYFTDQHPVIGALNNAAYELCNNDDFCSNNIYANTAFTIAVESIDAAIQAALNLASGNAMGTALKIAEAVEKISESINKSTSQIKVADVAKTTAGTILSAADKITRNKALEASGKGAIEASKQITEAVLQIVPSIIEEVAKETLSSAFNYIKEEAIVGAKVGALVSSAALFLYVPAITISEAFPANTCSLYGMFVEDVFSSISI